jgi:hypothetical protein
VLGAFEGDDPQRGAHHGVIYALAPSYAHRGTIWAGTDDGLVWITRDGGAHWKNVTPAQLTPWSKIAQIDASRYDDDTAFVAVNRFRLDDLRPYVYVTHDGGRTWKLAVSGLPDQPVNAVRQDPVVQTLLYAATENGVYVSFDGGAGWQPLQNDLPHTSMRDILVHDNDLIVATHGRGFWILDDVEPLREVSGNASLKSAYLFAPERAYRVRRSTNTDTPFPPEEPRGENPPDGAIVDYALVRPAHRVVLSFYDRSGRLVRRYASDDAAPAPIPHLDKPAYWERPFVTPSTATGMNRFVWDLREPPPLAMSQDLPISAVPHDTPRTPEGPLVLPGVYTVRLDVDGRTMQRHLPVVMDPRVVISTQALAAQYDLATRLISLANKSYDAAVKARGNPTATAAFTRINAAATTLLHTVDGADAPPTKQAAAAVDELERRWRAEEPRQ